MIDENGDLRIEGEYGTDADLDRYSVEVQNGDGYYDCTGRFVRCKNMINNWTKKEYPQFSLKWVRMSYMRPPRNGYYFMQYPYGLHIIYYDAKYDIVIMFSDNYTYAEYFRASVLEDKMWAKMSRLPIKSILNYGSIEIC